MKVLNTSRCKWKTVPVSLEVFSGKSDQSDSEFQFLSAIEEADEYTVVKNKGTQRKRERIEEAGETKNKAKKKKSGKKKHGGTNVQKSKLPEKQWSISAETKTVTDADTSQWLSCDVSPEIATSLVRVGFKEPTGIQRLVLPVALRAKLDIVAAAETGSGKTLAYGVPIVNGILEDRSERNEEPGTSGDGSTSALILVPTRELAVQVKHHLQSFTKDFSLKEMGYLTDLPSIRCLVLDETDRLLEKGHFAEVENILEMLNENSDLSQKRQNFILSATLTFVHIPAGRLAQKGSRGKMTGEKKVTQLARAIGLRKGFKVFDTTRDAGTAESLTEARMNCDNLEDKDSHLYYFLHSYPGRTLIFVNSIHCSRRLHNLLSKLRFTCYLLHARMHQKQRLKNLERFANEENVILIATDVAARGLDIRNVKHVIHYQVPRSTETYVHRSGRTARASKEGLSVVLVDASDAGYYGRICANLNRSKDLPLLHIDRAKLISFRERIKIATEITSLEHKHGQSSRNQDWWKRSAKAMDVELDVDDKEALADELQSSKKQKRHFNYLQRLLDTQLDSPLNVEHKLKASKYPTFYQAMGDTVSLESSSAIEVVKNDIKQASSNRGKKVFGRVKLKKLKKRKKGSR